VRIYLEPSIRIIIRPSGTEPKVKCYVEIVALGELGKAKTLVEEVLNNLEGPLRKILSEQ